MRRIAFVLVLLAGLATPAAAQAAPPTGVSGVALESRVELAWQPAAGAGSYAVYRGTAKNAISTRVSPPGGVFTTSYADTAVVNGTTYYYAVRAVIGGIESADSSPLQATPAARTCSAGSPVVLENCLPGNPNWRVLNPGNASSGGIEGFATQQSINKGESVGLKVRSSGPYDVQVFRMGYYGGAGARLVSSLRDLPATPQPACATDGTTGLVDCANWAQSSALSTTAGWTSGMYLLRIVRADNGADFHILVAVRDDARRSDILFGAAFTSYQAYNQYGGRSLYDFNSIGSNTVAGTPRAVKVSFDRPFEQPRTRQRDWYVEIDQPFVSWLEQEGYDVNYASDADLERFPSIARNAGAYFSPAHDEYWSGGMRTALEQARDAGTHLFFGGANEVYWKIRFENSPTTGASGRTQVCYKSTQSGGPDPSGIPTGTWRDPAGANKPENALTGAMYVGDKDFGYFPLRVSAAEGTDRVYRYTGLETQAPGASTLIGATLVGWEWDARVDNGAEPAGTKTLASSPVTGNLVQDHGHHQIPGSTTVNAVKYTAPSGALVVTAGTNHWWRGLARNVFNDGEPDLRIQQATTNILADMNATPRTPPANIVLDGTSAGVPVPVNTAATPVGTDSVRITWDPVAGASGYNVYRALAPRQDGLPLGTVASPGPVAATTFTDTGLEPATRYYYVVTAVVAGNQSRASAETSAQTPAAAGASTRINAGGSAYTTATGATYAADGQFTGGSVYATTSAITGSPDAALYQNERWGQFSYALPVANGSYDVRLHFVELYYGTAVAGGAGKRVFGMDIVDTAANPDLANIDPFAAAGARTPLVRTIPGVTITDGTLNLRSVYGAADDPQIAAIEVIPSAPAGPPSVTQTTPPNASANVATSTAPSATFSRAMDASTITGSTFTLTRADGAAVPATVAYNATTRVATLTPSAPLGTSSTYTARLTTGIKAADGPALADAVTWTFSTLGPAPAVTQTTPAGGAAGVSVGVRPTATFTRDLDPTTLTATSFTLTRADGAGVAAAVAYDAASRTATVTPSLALDGQTGYTAALETTIKAADGAALTTRVTWSFTTGAAPPGPPTVSGRTPAAGATGVAIAARPTAIFSRAMDAATISASSFTLRRPDGTTVPAVVGYDATSRTATLTPNADLANSTSYTARLESTITASDGLALASSPVTWSFTTSAAPDTTPPTVSVTAPASGASVRGAVDVAVTAADAVGVTGVQVRVDGNDVGAEDTTAPYTATWDTAAASNGAHTITAVARDAAGNRTTSASVPVTVDNQATDPTGLVAAYPLNETSGTTVADVSGNGNDGTISGAAFSSAGRYGGALLFDGVNDSVSIPDRPSLDLTTAMTLEAWVRPNSLTGWRTALLKENGADLAYSLYPNADNNRPSAHIFNGADVDARGTAGLPAGAWSHLAATWDRTTLRLYVDGTQVATRAVGGTIRTSTGPLKLGGNAIWGEFFDGRLDDVRVYSRALSATEVRNDRDTPVRSGTSTPPPGADVMGQFAGPVSWPVVPVHISTLSNGKIAVWDGVDAALNSERVWDPAAGTFDPVPNGRNLFCAGHVNLPDGRLFVAGGHVAAFDGLADANLFTPSTRSWTRAPDMARKRWYPTATTLPDGRVLVVSGDNITLNQPGQPVPLTNASETLPEIYDVEHNSWQTLPQAQRRMPLYPFMFVLPDGKIFDAGPDLQSRTLDLTTGQWSPSASSTVDAHSAVMYRPGKILKSGTWGDPDFPNRTVTNRAQAIDMTASSPAWRDVASMAHPRSYHTLTALPDGTVLATGGGTASDGVDHSKAVLATEIWDPVTDRWTTTASAQRPRLYHSSSVLLPDGRVLLAGGGAFGTAQNESNAEIYSPPYLFKGARPAITSAPQTIDYDRSFTVDSPDAARIASVSLVRMGSVTHNFDMDQRFMNLNLTRNGNTLTIDGPSDNNVAPPGWYTLFLLDDKGVPSVGAIMHILPPTTDTVAPTQPGSFTATGGVSSVKLDWAASADNVRVTEYRVYRSSTAGFTPSDANRIATVASGTTYTDADRPPGAYSYIVVALDAAGNRSPTSTEERATVTGDVTPPSQPAGVTATGGISSAVVDWTASTDDGGVTGYRIHRSTTAGFTPSDANRIATVSTGTTYTDTGLAAGTYRYVVVAADGAGNLSAPSAERSAVVTGDVSAPTGVAITAPAAATRVSGASVGVTASAADNVGVADVQFRLDGAPLGSPDTTAPYALTWDTRTVPDGAHTLTAVARDAAGNATTSAGVTVTVDNSVPPPAAGLVAAYGFEETTGTTALDSSGGGLNGTLSGPTRVTTGRFGSALSFDGVNDVVNVADANALDLTNGMTLEAWVNPAAVTGWRTVLMKEKAADLVYALYSNSDLNRPSAHVQVGGDRSATGTAQVALNTWTHLAATYDGTTERLYVGGIQVGTRAVSGAMAASTQPLRIGGNTIWTSEWFSGRLDEIRVYNRTLTAAEIQTDLGRAVKP